MNCPAMKSSAGSRRRCSVATSPVSGVTRSTTARPKPGFGRGLTVRSALPGISKLHALSARVWQSSTSSRSGLRYAAPGASAQSLMTTPETRRALQVPQVPVPHS